MGKGGNKDDDDEPYHCSSSRYLFIPGVKWILGPSKDAMKILRRVATARGLRDEDELLVVLGKKAHEFTVRDALIMMKEEIKDLEVHVDVYKELIYRPGKGYQPCNNLLKRYLQGLEEEESFKKTSLTEIRLEELKKYCSYTDAELRSLE